MDAPRALTAAVARLLIFVITFQTVAPQTPAPQLRSADPQTRERGTQGRAQLKKQDAGVPPALPGAAPILPASIQPSALFVVGSTNLSTSDAAIKARLEGLGYIVTVKSGNGSATTDANDKNLIFISSTVTPSQVNTKFRDVTVPVIVCASGLFDDMPMTGTGNSNLGTQTGQTAVQIVDATHAMAGGLGGSVTVVSASKSFTWGKPSLYAQKVATLVSDSTKATIFGYENGATMVGQVANARRIGFFLTDTVAESLTANGWTLFDGAVNWAVGRVHRQCLFVVGSTTLSTADSEIKKQLEGRGYTVTVKSGSGAVSGDANAKNLVVISATVSPADVNTKFGDVETPVLVAEPELFDDMGMTGTASGTDFGSQAAQTTVSILDPGHVMAGGLSGTVTVSSSATTIGWGKPATSAAEVASISGDATKIALFGYESGATMVGLTGPGRRAGIFFGDTVGATATEDGWKLFVRAVEWANTTTPVCQGDVTADVVLVIDRSGSMAGQRITDAKASAKDFVDSIDLATDQAGVASFSDNGTLNHQLSHDGPSIKTSIDGITTGGGTNIGAGITSAQTELTSVRHNAGAQPVILLLTDGANTVGDPIGPANAAKAAGTRIIAIGLGEASNTQMLSIVSSPNDYYYAPSSSDLSSLYTSIAGELCLTPNQPPVVSAGVDQTITLPASAALNGSASDDGLPTGSTIVVTWSKLSGPGTVSFANPNAAVTTASFSQAGSYVLRLTADDSELTATDDVVITVNAANQPPVVDAGADQTITLPSSATLSGSATDDGLPVGGSLTVTWSKTSGPGTVSFANPNAAGTTASFSEAGAYVLRLTASDTELTAFDEVTITVEPAANQPPTADAGPDQTITLPASVTLNGTGFDDGLPAGSSLSYLWTKVSGPGTVTFSSPTTSVTNATLTPSGVYVLRLTVSDSELASSDDVTVTVLPGTTPPVADFSVPGPLYRVAGTLVAYSSYENESWRPEKMLDFDTSTSWSTGSGQVTDQFAKFELSGSEEWLIDRVRLATSATEIATKAVKDFDVQVATTPNDADLVTVLTATYQQIGQQVDFVFPGGPVRARYVKLIARNNYGHTQNIRIATFHVIPIGSPESIISLPGRANAARNGSPSLIENGAVVVAYSSQLDQNRPPNEMLKYNGATWRTSAVANQFATIQLAGGKTYSLLGVTVVPWIDSSSANAVKDFEIWVSTTTADPGAFTQVLTGITAANSTPQTFLFPGGPVQARYVKYVPLTVHGTGTFIGTRLFDVIAEEVGRVVGVSVAPTSWNNMAERAIDGDAATGWSASPPGEPVDQGPARWEHDAKSLRRPNRCIQPSYLRQQRPEGFRNQGLHHHRRRQRVQHGFLGHADDGPKRAGVSVQQPGRGEVRPVLLDQQLQHQLHGGRGSRGTGGAGPRSRGIGSGGLFQPAGLYHSMGGPGPRLKHVGRNLGDHLERERVGQAGPAGGRSLDY